MKALAAVLMWVAAVGTFLVLGDDALSLYKSIEFRAAIPNGSEFGLIVAMYTAVGLSAALILLALVAGANKLGRARTIVTVCCLISAICAAIVLLLNGAALPEWPNRALEGKNESAVWCLLVSLIYVAATRRSRK
jgi:hypothetical protein